MCERCDKEVAEQGVAESDLPYLPYTRGKCMCIDPGCRKYCIIRDYGLSPYYFWPVERRVLKSGCWRGGWVNMAVHFFWCEKHQKTVNTDEITADKVMARIKEFAGKLKPGKIKKKPYWL